MDIFKFAIEREHLSEDCYRRLAGKTNNAGLQNIFLMLADEEKKHAQIVQDMQQNVSLSMSESSVLSDAQKVFEKMNIATDHFDVSIDEPELYKKAGQIEVESEQYYRQKAEETEIPEHKELFLKLAAEENKHYRLLESIGTFVEKPKWFLENAEMYRFDDYAGGTL